MKTAGCICCRGRRRCQAGPLPRQDAIGGLLFYLATMTEIAALKATKNELRQELDALKTTVARLSAALGEEP